MFSIGTGIAEYVPPGIPELKEVRCAVCYRPNTVCFEKMGDNSCPTGFSAAYRGWIMGGIVASNRENQLNHRCVNENFTNNAADNNNIISQLYGATVDEDLDIGLYTEDSFVRCAFCCKD